MKFNNPTDQKFQEESEVIDVYEARPFTETNPSELRDYDISLTRSVRSTVFYLHDHSGILPIRWDIASDTVI